MRGTTQKGKGPTSYLAKFWRKLHKNVEKIGLGEARQNVYYIDPPLLMTMTTTLIFRIQGSKCGWMMTTTTFCRQWCEFKSVQWPLQWQQQCSPAETYLMIVFFIGDAQSESVKSFLTCFYQTVSDYCHWTVSSEMLNFSSSLFCSPQGVFSLCPVF